MRGRHPLIELAQSAPVRRKSESVRAAARLDPAELASLYTAEVQSAPRRHAMGQRGGRYLGTRDGTTTRHSTNRREERLALALFNHCASGKRLELPGGTSVGLVDYQVPLRASRFDSGVGKIDLLGLDTDGRLVVIELKYAPPPRLSKVAQDTPLRAWLEGLAYCAMAWSNLRAIGREAEELGFGSLSDEPPLLVVLGNARYWSRQRTGRGPGTSLWIPELERLARGVETEIGLTTRFVGLEDGRALPYRDGIRPELRAAPKLAVAW